MNKSDAQKFGSDGLATVASELLVATADGSDQRVDRGVTEVLSMLRHVLKMDAVFVAEFVDGHRVFRHVDAAADAPAISPGQSDPLEASWCQRVVDGRLPQLIPKVSELPDRDQLPAIPFEIGTYRHTWRASINTRSAVSIAPRASTLRIVASSSTGSISLVRRAPIQGNKSRSN